MALRIHHFGIVVNDMDTTLEKYLGIFGLEPPPMGVFDRQDQGLKFTLLPMQGGILELLQAKGEPGVHGQRLRDALARNGEGFFQLCLFSDDFEAEVKRLRGLGYTVDEDTVAFPMDAELRVAFLGPEETNGLLIEIVDEASVPEQMR